jgi:hypothetical protein
VTTTEPPAVNAGPPTLAPRRGSAVFRVHPIVATLTLLVFIASLCISGTSGTSSLIVAVATPLIAVLVGLPLAIAAFYITKRSSLAFNLTLGVVVVATLGLVCTMPIRRSSATKSQAASNEEALAALKRANARMREATRQRLESGNGSPNQEGLDAYIKSLEEAAAKATGPEAIAIRAIIPMARSMGGAANHVLESRAKYFSAGALGNASLRERQDILDRIALLDALGAANLKFEQTIGTALKTYDETLLANGAPAAAVAAFQSGTHAKYENYHELCRIRAEFVKASRSYLEVLADNFGHWTLSETKFQFEDDVAAEALNQALAKVNEASAAESDWLKTNTGISPAGSQTKSDSGRK